MEQFHLFLRCPGRQRNIGRWQWAAQVTIPLGDLICQVELIAEYRRHDLPDGPVILVRITGRRPDNEVGREGAGYLLKNLFHLGPDGRKPALGQTMQFDGEVRCGQEGLRGITCFELTVRRSRQRRTYVPRRG